MNQPIDPQSTVTPATLRRRATLLRDQAHSGRDVLTADYLDQAANVIERLTAPAPALVVEVLALDAGEQLLDRADIPVIDVIEPNPDPVYGHTFQMPLDAIRLFTDAG